MKKLVGLFVIVVLMAMVLGCSMNAVMGDGSAVKMIPIIGSGNTVAGKSMASSRNIAISGSETNLTIEQLGAMAVIPVVTGWTTDTSSVNTVTNSFKSTVLGHDVTTSFYVSGTDVVFNGQFGDGGNFSITYHLNNNTFDFAQTVIYDYTPASGDEAVMLMNITMTGAKLNKNNTYSGNGIVNMCTFDKTTSQCWYVWSVPYQILAGNGTVVEYASVYPYTGALPTSAPSYSNQPVADWASINASTSIPVLSTTSPAPYNIYVISYTLGGLPNVNDILYMHKTLDQLNTLWQTAINGM